MFFRLRRFGCGGEQVALRALRGAVLFQLHQLSLRRANDAVRHARECGDLQAVALNNTGQHRNCFHSCTTNASPVISTKRLVAKAASMPDIFARNNFSNSALLMLPVEINNSSGSPVTRKVWTKSASLLTTM